MARRVGLGQSGGWSTLDVDVGLVAPDRLVC